MERLSVMASTADIHVRARRGSTTQELQSEALSKQKRQQYYVVARHAPGHNQTPIHSPQKHSCAWHQDH